MYSMKRAMCPEPRQRSAIGRMSPSLTPRFTTMLIFTAKGRPQRGVDALEHFRHREIDVVHGAKMASSSESRLTVTRSSPARARPCAFLARSEAVGGQGKLHIERFEHRHQAIEVAAHQRLAPVRRIFSTPSRRRCAPAAQFPRS